MDDRAVGAAIVGGAADAVVVTDRNGLITLWNPGATRMFGFDATEAVGESLDIIIPDRLREAHWDGYSRFIATAASRYPTGHLLRVPALTRGGSTISVEFTLVAMTDDDGLVTHAVAVLRDATEAFESARALRLEVRELRHAADQAGDRGAHANA